MEVQRKLASLDVILWLRENYKVGKSGSTSKNAVYQHYCDACQEKGIEPIISATYFGKLVKRAFPGVKYNRKGPRGSAVQHYTCLKRIKQMDGTVVCASVTSPYAPHADYGAVGVASVVGDQYSAEELAMCPYSFKREKVDHDESSPSLSHSPTPVSFSPRRRHAMFPRMLGPSAHPHAHPYAHHQHHHGGHYPHTVLHPRPHHPPVPPQHYAEAPHPSYRTPLPLGRVSPWPTTTTTAAAAAAAAVDNAAADAPLTCHPDTGAPYSSPDGPPSSPWPLEGRRSLVPPYHHSHHLVTYADPEEPSPSPYAHPHSDPYHFSHPHSASAPNLRFPSPPGSACSPHHRSTSHNHNRPHHAHHFPHHPGHRSASGSLLPSVPPPSSSSSSSSPAYTQPHYLPMVRGGHTAFPSCSSNPTSPSGSSHIGSSNPPSPPSPPPHLLLPSLDSATFTSSLLPPHPGGGSSTESVRPLDSSHPAGNLHHPRNYSNNNPRHLVRPQQTQQPSSALASQGSDQASSTSSVGAVDVFEPPSPDGVYPMPPFASAVDPHQAQHQSLRPPFGRSASPALEHLLRGIVSRDVEDEELVSFCDRYLKQAHTP